MTATNSTRRPFSSDDSEVDEHDDIQPASPISDFEYLSPPDSHTSSRINGMTASTISDREKKARLIYCKSHVSIHPTQFNKDNISGYLALVEADDPGFSQASLKTDEEGKVTRTDQGRKQVIVTWVPDEVLQRMDERDREGFRRVEGRSRSVSTSSDLDEDGFVFVSLPPPKGEKYAFSVPLGSIYSILVYQPSLQHWYGSATFNLIGGISLPTLFFHDDESPLLASARKVQPSSPPRPQWGFPPFLSLLQTHATLLRSRLLADRGNHNAELWLVNPSKSDRDVHDADLEIEDPINQRHGTASAYARSSGRGSYPPDRGFPDPQVLNNQPTPKQTLLTGLSNITSFSRRLSQQILSHPLAQEVVPHLPPAVRSLVNVPGEWDSSGNGRAPNRKGRNDVASEFESARLYLARWARVVAEEGERARRNEAASRVGTSGSGDDKSDVDDLTSSLGVFSLLSSPNSKRPVPHPTRTPSQPITSEDWESFAVQGRDELYVRREIFRRGFSNSSDPEAQQTRREGWEVLLGIVPWPVGGLGEGQLGNQARRKGRQDMRTDKRAAYEQVKRSWCTNLDLKNSESWKEEWHRIDVDCRRTDRTQPIFALPSRTAQEGPSEDEIDVPGLEGGDEKEDEGGMAKLNPHIAALRTILMTYHTYSPELGYVQGMSDLLSPIYVVFGANEADSFWGLVGLMKMMESNFLRDQSGMKQQLSTLQQLIGVMDPELYDHLERTGSLNLFFCFRWILIAFKREFKFEDVINLWEVLWTNYYSDQFVLFVALAILQSHRDVLMRYLSEFDEVLKYANDLSGTIDLQTTLNQAEVLFLQFRGIIDDFDQQSAQPREGAGEMRKRKASASEDRALDASRAAARDRDRQHTLDDLRGLLTGFSLDRRSA